MQFIYQALVWGFLITLVPLLIHLINMLRHRRVRWAAMDFLLQSYKKHRRWVWLKQLLLLLARMAAIALVVAMLAQWDPRGSWLQGLGGKTTHHYVLLDDSYSMSERQGAGSVYENALRAVAKIGSEASQQRSPQRFTLLRFSRAAVPPDEESAAADIADLSNVIVDAEFSASLEETQRTLEVSQLTAGPRPALELLKQMLDEGRNENNVVYIVSDFRAQPWETPAQVRDLLQEVEESEARLHLISAARVAEPNLGIESIQPDGSTRAAGVPLFINVAVRNHGQAAANKVQLKARVVQCDPELESASQPGEFEGQAQELQAELIDSIPAGGSATARFQVVFPTPGKHVFEVELPSDTVDADNRRWSVIEFQAGEPVLAIEDRLGDRNARFLTTILDPGGQANTGLRPVIQPSAYLRDTPLEELQRYSAIYLFGVDQLLPPMVENLEAYVRGGGGLAVFMGPGVNLQQYNEQLYRDGEGLLPLPLGRDWLLAPPIDEAAPDVDISGTTHPVFRDLLRGRNPIVRMVKVERYIETPASWSPEDHAEIEVLARLHNGLPLAAEKRFGDGRVFQFMSTFAPDWNDLALGPNVLMMLNLQAHLAATRRLDDSRLTGAPLQLELNEDQFEEDVEYVVPTAKSSLVVERQAVHSESGAPLISATLAGQTRRAGVYEAWIHDLDGSPHVRRYAVNVDPNEGSLRLVDPQLLLASLEPVRPDFMYADEVYDIVDQSGFNPSMWIMGLLILLLLGEQILAYLVSYHPARQGEAS